MTPLKNLFKTGNEQQRKMIIQFLNQEVAKKGFFKIVETEDDYDIEVQPHPLYPMLQPGDRREDLEDSVIKWLEFLRLIQFKSVSKNQIVWVQ